ncbi:hypothetical protein ACFSJG_24290 [Rhodococcus gannanensis]|uniref:Uncharacterized protein n=1 Tax=Rhodococcus gannanensis TaxID=1960308 RepID=A0ABW4PE29_9NOCA
MDSVQQGECRDSAWPQSGGDHEFVVVQGGPVGEGEDPGFGTAAKPAPTMTM